MTDSVQYSWNYCTFLADFTGYMHLRDPLSYARHKLFDLLEHDTIVNVAKFEKLPSVLWQSWHLHTYYLPTT